MSSVTKILSQEEPVKLPNFKRQKIRVAVAGNPNCGKTTLFNSLTGSRYKVANYPGVTVEKKEGKCILPSGKEIVLVDLPGIYSLSASSIDEKIAFKTLIGDYGEESTPDAILAVVDASNIERNLYLISQLVDTGIPLLLVLNMMDIAEKRGIRIYSELLSRLLDLPIVSIVASKGQGVAALYHGLDKLLQQPRVSIRRFAWASGHEIFCKLAEKLGEIELGEIEQNIASGIPLLVGCNLLSEGSSSQNSVVLENLHQARAQLRDQSIDPYTYEATSRYQWINSLIARCCSISKTEKSGLAEILDKIFTHRIWGIIVFLFVMGFIFQSIFLWAQMPMNLIDNIFVQFSNWTRNILPPGQLNSLLVDGVIAGVGSIVIFVPQIAILFFFLGLLEDSGYLSRAAFLMDRVMRPVGLQGRSFVPLLSSFACAIPGILSTRTIPSWADRIVTIMIAPLMSCSARLPVYALLIAAFIPNTYYYGFISLQGLTLFGMYILGVAAAAIVSLLLRQLVFHHQPALFVMEMPSFKLPSVKIVLREVLDRVYSFLSNAGTIIVACSIVLWFLASYPKPEENYQGNKIEFSYAGRVGKLMEPVIKPLGFNWEVGVGLLASFAAREVFVSSLATVYNVEDNSENSRSLIELLRHKKDMSQFTTLTAISLMVFYVFACQCMSTLAVCKRETGSWKWTGFMFVYMTTLAYFASLATYQIGSWIFGGA